MKRLLLPMMMLLLLCACTHKQQEPLQFAASDIGKVISQMTEVMVHDVTNPPLSSRFFSYACLAGYEVLRQHTDSLPRLHNRLRDYPRLDKPDSIENYDTRLAALFAMMEVSARMQPSGKLVADYKKHFTDSLLKAGVTEAVVNASDRYAKAVSKAILAYAKADGYNRISNLPRYTPAAEDGSWYPTPPAYMAAVEPHFRTVRAYTLDSATEFKPKPPVPFSEDPRSRFFALLQQNYRLSLTDEQKAIAAFWDCNPFAVQDNGHLLVGLKKISPGAHWLGITGIACQQAGKSFEQAMQIFTAVAIGLQDGFICCWDEKFRSNRVRPETVIRKYIDPNWRPLLQTPPFPEYLSGHSTISAASATILTHFFGPSFAYTDTVELRYGLPARKFSSFKQAAEEAAISRFYGGIHFMDAIENGLVQGEQVGQRVLDKVVR